MQEINTHHYFVDEAGDLSFFDKKGRIIVGKPGSSKYFMVGVAQLSQPNQVTLKLEKLRRQLCSDPRYKNIPSMQPKAKKTVIAFHAKDDHPDVRQEVFKLMQSFDVKILVAIRKKQPLAIASQKVYKKLGKKTEQNAIYDDLIKRLFTNLLHKADSNRIVFAHRGKRVREVALNQAIIKAKRNFERKWNIQSNSIININSAYPSECAGLQVIDYYLWALQRLYEREDEQFFDPLVSKYSLIIDLDDRRKKTYGEYYNKYNPLTLNKLKKSLEG